MVLEKIADALKKYLDDLGDDEAAGYISIFGDGSWVAYDEEFESVHRGPTLCQLVDTHLFPGGFDVDVCDLEVEINGTEFVPKKKK